MNRCNATCVPLYETLGDNAVEYILRHSEAVLVVVVGAKLGVLAKALAAGGLAGQLTGGVVVWGDASEEAKKVGVLDGWRCTGGMGLERGWGGGGTRAPEPMVSGSNHLCPCWMPVGDQVDAALLTCALSPLHCCHP